MKKEKNMRRLSEQEIFPKTEILKQLEDYMIKECLHKMINNATLEQLKKIFVINEFLEEKEYIGYRVKSLPFEEELNEFSIDEVCEKYNETIDEVTNYRGDYVEKLLNEKISGKYIPEVFLKFKRINKEKNNYSDLYFDVYYNEDVLIGELVTTNETVIDDNWIKVNLNKIDLLFHMI